MKGIVYATDPPPDAVPDQTQPERADQRLFVCPHCGQQISAITPSGDPRRKHRQDTQRVKPV